MAKRSNWEQYFLDIAEQVATRSTCPRAHVGAVLTLGNYIISTGYNGSEPGKPHCDDVGCEMVNGHCVRTRHAEWNAYRTLTKINKPLSESKKLKDRMVLYCTHKPCKNCEALLKGYGIEKIVYKQEY